MEDFYGLFPVTKTLKFELKPIGNTLEKIKKQRLIDNDIRRKEDYKKVKLIIDDFHKTFIEGSLKNIKLDWCLLGEKINKYKSNKDVEIKKEIEDIQRIKRNELSNNFLSNPLYKSLFKKELIDEILKNDLSDDDRVSVENFKSFFTYFSGFNEVRELLYTNKEISSSIAFRVVHDNFPKFLSNINTYKDVVEEYPEIINLLGVELEEFLQGIQIEDIFSLDFFNYVLSQKGIDLYNLVIGGLTLENGIKLRGFNEFINIYKQRDSNNLKNKKISKMIPLFKQVLSDRESLSFVLDSFTDDNDVIKTLNIYNDKIKENDIIFNGLFDNISDYDTTKIYIKTSELNKVSGKLFGSWDEINKLIVGFVDINLKTKKERENYLKLKEYSIYELNNILEFHKKDLHIEDYFKTVNENISKIRNYEFDEILNKTFEKNGVLKESAYYVEKIKGWLDNIVEVLDIIKVLNVNDELEKDNDFYELFNLIFNNINLVTPLYNQTRNYFTQKPFSTEKLATYFENKGNFLGGWVDSGNETELNPNGTQGGGYIFRKLNSLNEYDYFLGVTSNKQLFKRYKKINDNDISLYERMEYYQVKTTSVYGSSYQGKNTYVEDKELLKNEIMLIVNNSTDKNLIEEINKDKNKKTPFTDTPSGLLNFIKNKNEVLYKFILSNSDFKKVNDNVVVSLKNTLKTINRIPLAIEFSKKEYTLFTEIIDDIKTLSNEKVLRFFNISQEEFDENLNKGEKSLLLFKIQNKDMSFAENVLTGKRNKIGNKNLHTLYFESLMNGEDGVFDIGTGMVFFREKSINYDENILKNGHHYNELKDKFSYPIIKDKRYSDDKFLFHLSVTANYNSNEKNINKKVTEYLKNNKDVNIIGLDRGEKNLLYMSVINQKGDILEQKSFNIVNGVNYLEKLIDREKERDTQRKSWKNIDKIKDLKEGYLSQVIHEISKKMIEYNAIVVLEDLNFGFKRGRFKVERQVYQKFEKMLIEKLNYLVFKNNEKNTTGYTTKAYQLTEKFDSFNKLGKQSGFLFYVPAAYTSKIDPTTGFVNLLNCDYKNVNESKKFLGNFDNIRYNNFEEYFEFDIDYSKFNTKIEDYNKKWTICTSGDKRYVYVNKEINEINVTKKIISLLSKNGIEYKNNKNLKEDILLNSSSDFFKTLLWLLKTTLQIRYSNSETNEDYILSPIKNSNNEFFNSSLISEKILPVDSDANGAFHIALKGLILLEKINNDKKDLKIEHKEYLKFTQSKTVNTKLSLNFI